MSEICGEHKYDAEDFQWCPFCEIDRLRAEVEAKDKRIEKLENPLPTHDRIATFPEVTADRDRLRAEVERLKSREITDEQIDAAWSFIDSTQGSDVADARALGAYRALRSVGIVECPECRGSGVYTAWDFHPNEEPHHGQTCSACERCHGHGWIREEHGDE